MLIAGVAAGASGRVPAVVFRHIDTFTTVILFIMLAALGAQIGSNSELVGNLAVLGWRALVISLFSITGSVLALWLVVRYLKFSVSQRYGE